MHFVQQILIIIILALLPFTIFATHNRGGEITYEHISGLTYKFKVTTCTDISSAAQADRSELYIAFGDGNGDTIPRSSIVPIPGFPNHQKNIYVGTHTFVTSGTYIISVEDPNRNANILNIYPNGGGSSDNVVFSLKSKLIINPFLGNGGANNSIVFDDCPCPAIACVGKQYCYNPQAVDPDGDSLSYQLVAPLGINAEELPIPTVYLFPNQVGSNGGNINIDPITGTICWDSPHMIGEFNFTIKITEWRNGYEVGYVIRDIQLTVQSNCSNEPPVITQPVDVCVVAGETINFDVTVTDIDNNNTVNLTASGKPLSIGSNLATFNTSGNNPTVGTFNWNTDCSNIKNGAYQVLFSAQDNGTPQFSDYKQSLIKVTPPKITGVNAVPFGNGVNITWNPSSCANAEGYRIYRTTNPNYTLPSCCDSPNLTQYGFTQVGQIFGVNNTSYFDNTSLTLGIDYCYIVTSFYNVGQIESCPSDTSCTRLRKEVPVITHVTVNKTDNSLGVDSIMWSKPSELDTNVYQSPYYYKVYHGYSINSINTLIGQTNTSNFLYNTDTVFVHNNINTSDNPNYYRVELFYNNNGNDSLIGSSNRAGSIFVTTTSNDNQITLNWNENVPWIDTSYIIYRSNSIGGNYIQIGQTNNQTYTDVNLTNGKTYCYYVKSIGYYSSPSIITPIENISQEVCDVPIDKTPPCPTHLEIEGDCALGNNKLVWINTNNSCSDDVTRYNVYYTPIKGDSMKLITTINSEDDTIFYHNNNGSVAGCYYITSLDSLQYNNESKPSNTVCFDNCPNYWLPNVFTPNSDGKNEYFEPLKPYKYIESIDLKIFNRWGQEVFSTTNPDIKWDGKNNQSREPVPSGVYYYICTVNTIRLKGIDPVMLKGFIHLFRDKEGE